MEPSDAARNAPTQINTASHGGIVFGVQNGSIIPHPGERPLPGGKSRIRILMLAANPASSSRLALDEEVREITEKLRLARDRHIFDLVTRWAVRPADLLQHLNDQTPQIVHFSGHGDANGAITLAGINGRSQPVSTEALTDLFRVMKDDVRVVVLNACYSAIQAAAIGTHIDHVVGMRQPINDRSATMFAAAFYSALGFGRKVGEAFAQGKTSLMLNGMPDHDVPQLISRPGATDQLISAY